MMFLCDNWANDAMYEAFFKYPFVIYYNFFSLMLFERQVYHAVHVHFVHFHTWSYTHYGLTCAQIKKCRKYLYYIYCTLYFKKINNI